MVNPYRELNRTMTQKRINADNLLLHAPSSASEKSPRASGEPDLQHTALGHHSSQLKSDHNVIDFGRWFFFCQHCRHGGHANCVDQWFGGSALSECSPEGAGDASQLASVSSRKSTERIVCGVNGCNCNCKARK